MTLEGTRDEAHCTDEYLGTDDPGHNPPDLVVRIVRIQVWCLSVVYDTEYKSQGI